MTKTIADKIAPLAKALQDLPDDTQDAVLAEAESRAAELSGSHMTDAQRDEVKRRLALPRSLVSHEDVRAILRHFNPVL